jgi:hypothetical protein
VQKDYVFASGTRLALAIYLDYLLFGSVWSLGLRFLASGESYDLAQYLSFASVEALLIWMVKWSPGEFLMSMEYLREPDDPIEPEGHRASGRLAVHSGIWARETVLTIALGVYFILDGTKSLVRWTTWSPPAPFFGSQLTADWGVVLAVVSGLVFIGLGAAALRLAPFAPHLVIAFSLFQLADIGVIWRLWDDFTREMIVRRREHKGLPVREGEIEFAQAIMPEGAVAAALAQIAVAVISRRRFS